MKKKENVLINGCSRGLGYDFLKSLKSKFNIYGLSSVKTKKKNILYYNPLIDINLTKELIKKLNNIRIDHVIHCSGGGFKKHDKLLNSKNLQELFNVNFYSIYEVNKFLIRKKQKNHKLNIIMFSSIAAFESKASIGYSATKSILLNYNKNLATNFSKDNVITKLVIPGSFISTKGAMNRLKKSNKKVFSKLEKEMPFGVMQKSKDIIKFSEFLLKNDSDLLNGSYISLSNLESKSIFL
jgi:short-subunit dehydrogenase